MLATENLLAQRGQFVFADHLTLDESPTRDFYKDLLRGLAHKNNNVLAVVQGFSSLILMSDDLDENTRENVQQMRDSSQHAATLSGERILTASGCARISAQPIQLAEYLPLMEGSLRQICERNKVGFTMTLGENLPRVSADTSRLKELLVELMNNAAEAAAEAPGGLVQLDILPPGVVSPIEENRLDMIFRNNGASISEERLTEVFRPFYSTKGSHHFGIGITTAGVLAGQMKMRLGITSGEGLTTVWVSAPAVA